MNKTKKYIALSLATTIALSPLVVKADSSLEEKNIIPISAPIDKINQVEEVAMPDYIKYEGKITEIRNEGKSFSILIKNDESDPYNGMVFHINEDTILLKDETKDFVTKDSLKEGMTVSGYYSKDTVMAMSLPPQLSPDAIIINESKDPIIVHISNFDKDLISSDGGLKIDISESTVIVDKNGNKIDKQEIENKDLIVFYSLVKESYPAQTTPEKIILIEKEEVKVESEITVLDKITINKKETALNKTLYKNEEGVVMIPLRQIAETLGYEVKWDNETRTAELTKGAQWTAVKIGEDNYNFAKMLVKLGTAPEVKDSTTYVPFNFLEEVLRVNVQITEEGIIEINQ